MKTCSQCGEPTSVWSRGLFSGVCAKCTAKERQAKEEAIQVEEQARLASERKHAEEQVARAHERADQERTEAERILTGQPSDEQNTWLTERGFVVAARRLVECPICRHDRFVQQYILMNTRAATLFNMDWASRGADTRTCQRCGYVLWFLR